MTQSLKPALGIMARLPGLWLFPMVLFIAAIGDGWVNEGPVLCMIRRLTGVTCPGCGLTRSFVALLYGRWSSAMHHHPLAPLVMATMIGWWLYACVSLWRRQLPAKVPSWLWSLGLGVVLTFGGWRLWLSG